MFCSISVSHDNELLGTNLGKLQIIIFTDTDVMLTICSFDVLLTKNMHDEELI